MPRSGRACGRGTCRTAARGPGPPRAAAAAAGGSHGRGRARAVRSGGWRAVARAPTTAGRAVGGGWPAGAGAGARPPADRRRCAAGTSGHVDPAGHRPRRRRRRRPAARRATRLERSCPRRSVSRRRARPARPVRRPRQRRIGLVDLGHQAGRDARRRGVVAGQVRMVLPGEPPPGGLDLGRLAPRLDAEDVMGIAFRHVASVSARATGRPAAPARPRGRPATLDSPAERAVPLAPCHDFAGPASPPRSPPPRSRSPTASRVVYRRAGRLSRAAPAVDRPVGARPGVRGRRRAVAGTRSLPGWFIPARDGAPGPGVALVHGWESARDRTLPIAEFLHRGRLPLPHDRRPRPRREPAPRRCRSAPASSGPTRSPRSRR